jgi:sarcosine oxidase subunit alpha
MTLKKPPMTIRMGQVAGYIALGYLKNGHARTGQKMRAVNLLAKTEVEVEIVSPHFFDPEGERLRG